NATTAADALSNSTNLTSSINAFLIQEISSSNINLNIGGIIYTASDIVKNITISFPQNTAWSNAALTNSISLNDDENGVIPLVKLSYNSILLNNNQNTWTFKITGFKQQSLQEVYSSSVLNSSENITIAKYIANIFNGSINYAPLSSSNLIVSGYNATTAADALSNVPELKNAISNAFLKMWLSIFSDNHFNFIVNAIAFNANDFISQLDVILPSDITLQDDLIGQIPVQLEFDGTLLQNIGTNKNTFIVQRFKQTTKEAVGQTIISSTNSSNTTSSSNSSSTTPQDINELIANKLSNLLSATINVAVLNNITAATALTNITNLVITVINEIQSEISSSTFIFNNIIFSTQDICNNIAVYLPPSITVTNDENGVIDGVSLQYNGITLKNLEKIESFTITGFKQVTFKEIGDTYVPTQTPTPNGESSSTDSKMASQISSILSSTIALSEYSNVTASNALLNWSTLIVNIGFVLQEELKNSDQSFVYNGTTFTASDIINALSISLPSSITTTNDTDGEIPNIKLYYENVLLTSKTGSSTFTATGFQPSESNDLGTTPVPNPLPIPFKNAAPTNVTSRDELIAKKLDGILNNVITIKNFQDITAADALADLYSNSTITLSSAIKDAITLVLTNNDKIAAEFNEDYINYSIEQIISNINVILPNFISYENDTNGLLTGVVLQFANIRLMSTQNTFTFTISGFKNAVLNSTIPLTSQGQQINSGSTQGSIKNTTQTTSSTTNWQLKRNMSISNTIELMLQNGINISGYDNITAANALLNSSTLITAIKNTILSKLNQINLDFLGVCYSAKDILAGINIELP
ncbi:MAG: hypothetical protein IIT97_02700, partial [Mycoplasmataceae bacterium]|nr:hypothetical protein [Mycoplasmataceae bacterium]